MKKRASIVTLCLTFALTASYTSGDAFACGSAIRMAEPSPTQMIASAERVLEVSPKEAVRVVSAAFPAIRSATPGKDPLQTRALRVLAVALVRSNPSADDLRWAVQTLRDIDKVRNNDPAVQADLGEALSNTDKGKTEAFAILSKLAEKDLMGSPYAYVALAKLRQEKGDTAGAQAAMTKCKEMSGKNAASTCKLVVAAKA
jgi:hypothetical protein